MDLGRVYDYVIVGSGPSGLASAIALSRKGKDVLVLEAKPSLPDKVCGDGLSFASVPLLERLGILESELRREGATTIKRKLEFFPNGTKETIYAKCGYGLSRPKLIELLRKRAENVDFRFGFRAQKTRLVDGIYVINSQIAGKNILNCSGAVSSFDGEIAKDMPLGISSRIFAKAREADRETFYFFYGPEYADGYAWLFPLEQGKWNIGVWNGNDPMGLKAAYRRFVEEILPRYVRITGYDRRPGGAFIGASEERASSFPRLGDAAGHANRHSGEGIRSALADALAYADGVD